MLHCWAFWTASKQRGKARIARYGLTTKTPRTLRKSRTEGVKFPNFCVQGLFRPSRVFVS
jgi:hypothetical protein